MEEAEFDKFADEYAQHLDWIGDLAGENKDFFAEYKVRDVAAVVAGKDHAGGLRILDFGAGVGSSVLHFETHFPACHLTCLDVSRRSLAFGTRMYGGRAKFVHFDGRSVPFGADEFDVVFAACVFHHIEHSEHVGLLTELGRVLRPGGSIVVFEHNPYNPLTVRVVNKCVFDEDAVLIRPREMVKRFDEAGFTRIKRRYRLFFPGGLRSVRPLEAFLVNLPLGAQYSVCGEKPGAIGREETNSCRV